MTELQTWITTTYYDLAQTAQPHFTLTIAAGFEGGQNESYEVTLDGEHPRTDHDLVLRVLEILDEELRPNRHPRLCPAPSFLVGYLAGYVHDYLTAPSQQPQATQLLPVWTQVTRSAWLERAYLEIALATPLDTERLEEAYEEGQNLFHAALSDGTLPKTEQAIALEMLTMVDEAMRTDLSLNLPASPNWAVGFLAGYVQAYVEAQQPKTQPLAELVQEEV